jgi:hypothetical protein
VPFRAGHDALMAMYWMRFQNQIDLVAAAGLLECWPERG